MHASDIQLGNAGTAGKPVGACASSGTTMCPVPQTPSMAHPWQWHSSSMAEWQQLAARATARHVQLLAVWHDPVAQFTQIPLTGHGQCWSCTRAGGPHGSTVRGSWLGMRHLTSVVDWWSAQWFLSADDIFLRTHVRPSSVVTLGKLKWGMVPCEQHLRM